MSDNNTPAFTFKDSPLKGTPQPPRITFNTEIVEGDLPITEWVGEVIADQWDEKEQRFGGGWQWTTGVKPLNGFVKGRTGALWSYCDAKDNIRENSKFGVTLKAYREVFGSDEEDLEIGTGALVGRVAVFVQRREKFGYNFRTKQELSGMVLIPIRLATDEELREFGRLGEYEVTTFDWDEESVTNALEVLNGKTQTNAKVAIMKSDLSPQLQTRLVNGDGIEYLMGRGLLVIENKTYKVNVEA